MAWRWFALAILVLAGCASPARDPMAAEPVATLVPDPTLAGPLTFSRADYDFGQLLVDDSENAVYRYPVPVRGSVHAPDGAGPYPVLLLLHGRHVTCSYGGVQFLSPGFCPNATVVEPVDSFRGYDYLASNLASHGYVVLSMDANTINDRDLAGDAGANARGRLTLFTLDHLLSVNATGRSLPDTAGTGDLTVLPRTEVPDLQGRLDLSRVGLMGHSRGGEGVARSISLDAENEESHGIDAVFALAPTDFARWPVAGVAFATLLPYCDGDVSNLQGAWMYDDARRLEPAAPRHQVLAMGANHNFYNTVWDQSDWGQRDDPWCDMDEDGRDSDEQQRAHGLGLMASFFRLYVGNEQAFAPYWDGHVAWPTTLCPDRPACDDRLLTSTIPLPDRRHDLASDGSPARAQGIETTICEGVQCPSARTIGVARQSAWDCHTPGDAVFPVPGGVAGWSAFSLRVGVGVGSNPVSLRFDLLGGQPATLGTVEIQPPPGADDIGAKTVLNELRFDLTGLPASALASATEVSVHCSADGGVQVADVMLVR